MWLRNVEMKLFKAGGDFELMAQRARRHWALSDATRTKGIGGLTGSGRKSYLDVQQNAYLKGSITQEYSFSDFVFVLALRVS